MPESKVAAKARLTAEGRWPEAMRFRERKKAEGASPAEAHSLMVEAFPPLPPGQPVPANGQARESPPPAVGAEGGASSLDRPVQRRWRGRTGKRLDLLGAITWAANNMDLPPDTLIAPSALAGALQKFANRKPDEFIETYLPRMLPKAKLPAPGEDDEGQGEDAALVFAREFAEKYKAGGPRRESVLEELPAKYCDEPEGADGRPQPPAVPRRPAAQPELEQAASPSPSPPKPLLCSWCERHGAQANCGACMDIRESMERYQAATRA